MKEKIVEFKEITSKYDGFAIVTNKQTIKIGIDNEQDCCERWGYFVSEDELDYFIGAQIIDLTITDTELKTGLVKKHDAEYRDEGDIMFVNVNTDKGTLQFAAYNCHNGYYGHEAFVKSEQLNHEVVL